MTMIEITVRAYWAASKALAARQSAADRAMLTDTLAHIATHASGRIAQAAASRLDRARGGDGRATDAR
jgi:hypothetical protein